MAIGRFEENFSRTIDLSDNGNSTTLREENEKGRTMKEEYPEQKAMSSSVAASNKVKGRR
jgi:hypothetical protein